MRRSARFFVVVTAAFGVAVCTGYVVASDLTALHRRAEEFGPPRTVVVASRDLPLGATVRAGDLRRESLYAYAVPSGAVGTPEDAIGRVVRVPLIADALVLDRQLAPRDRRGLGAAVGPGQRAVRVVNEDGMRPEPGAVVDVLAALDPVLAPAAEGAVVVVQGAQVLEADTVDQTASDGSGGVTLLVTEEEARGLAFAAANGVLTLALAPPEAACCASPEP